MAEIELSVLHRQCTQARIPDQTTLITQTAAWYQRLIKCKQQYNGISPLRMLASNYIDFIR